MASGTAAPEASVTVPLICAVPCAHAAAAASVSKNETLTAYARDVKILFVIISLPNSVFTATTAI